MALAKGARLEFFASVHKYEYMDILSALHLRGLSPSVKSSLATRSASVLLYPWKASMTLAKLLRRSIVHAGLIYHPSVVSDQNI
jgi:hypothetical protein